METLSAAFRWPLKEVFNMSGVKVFKARKMSPGKASGPAVVTKKRLGFRGFVNIEEGTFTKATGDLEGISFAGAILIFPSSRGASSW